MTTQLLPPQGTCKISQIPSNRDYTTLYCGRLGLESKPWALGMGPNLESFYTHHVPYTKEGPMRLTPSKQERRGARAQIGGPHFESMIAQVFRKPLTKIGSLQDSNNYDFRNLPLGLSEDLGEGACRTWRPSQVRAGKSSWGLRRSAWWQLRDCLESQWLVIVGYFIPSLGYFGV